MLLFGMLTVFLPCKGQDATKGRTKPKSAASTSMVAEGQLVSEVDKSSWYVHQDRSGNMWFGSNGHGVYRYAASPRSGLKTELLQFTTKDGLCNDQVRGIQEDSSGNIYINTVGGISKFDGRIFTTMKSTSVYPPEGGWQLRPGDLWFQGAQDSGLVYRYDGTSLYRLAFPKISAGEEFIAKYPRSKYPQMNYNPYDVYSIYKDRKGDLWFGTNLGVCHYDGTNFMWTSERELGIDAISFHVRSTIEDKNGHYWFGNTMHRFSVFSGDSRENGSVVLKEEKGINNPDGFDDSDFAYFMSALEDDNGNLWLATYENGVWRYDGGHVTHYDVKDGNNNIKLVTIYKDRKGAIWLGTDNGGIYKLEGKTFEKFRN